MQVVLHLPQMLDRQNFVVSANSAQVVSFNEGYSAASTVTILGDTDSTDTINNNSNY